MSSRPLLLVFLLMVLVFTSQFEWRQQLSDFESNSGETQKQIPKREEVVKEKIILTQEKKIQRLKELVKNLKGQLQQCHCHVTNETSNGKLTSLAETSMEVEQHIPEE